MSVVITRLDMPKCCIDCPIYNDEFGMCNCIPNSRSYSDDGTELYDPFKEKNSKCPLREIVTEDPLDKDAKEASIPDLGTHQGSQ